MSKSMKLVLPGSKEFEKTMKKVDLRPAKRAKSLILLAAAPPIAKEAIVINTGDLVGHTLMLNTAIRRTFQCGGFQLGPLRPFAVVEPTAQQTALHRGLEADELIDVTGQDMSKKGFKINGRGETSPVDMVDTGKRVYVGNNKKGDTFIVTAKNKTEQKKIERELKANKGKLKGFDYTTASTGLSGIISEDVPTDAAGHLILTDCVPLKAPVKKPILQKAKTNVRTSSRKRKSQ